MKWIALLLALWLASPAHAQIFSDSEARKAILELRAKLATEPLQQKDSDLSARIDRLETAQRNQLELANQTETLRQEISRLRGQIEALTNEVATLQQRNRDLYADLDARLKKMEPSTVAVDGKSVAVDRSELTAYEAALAQFRASDFKGALSSFQQFVARYPQSAYVPVAHYWIGSSHYALKEYKSAIAAQQILVDRYSDSTRAPDALLSIAESQLQLSDKKSANRTLGRLIKDYPESEAAKVGARAIAGDAIERRAEMTPQGDLVALATIVVASIFALAFAFGAITQRTNFCTMGSVADIVTFGDWTRMRQWLLAIASRYSVPIFWRRPESSIPPTASTPRRASCRLRM